MQTPQSGTGFAIDGWIEGSNAVCQPIAFVYLTRRVVWVGLTVAIAVAAVSGCGLWYRVTHERYVTQIGQLGLAELPDGSMAILNTSTEIELAFTRGVRRVRLLSGEALFDVAADPKRPFVAEAAGFRAETQGTTSGLPRRDGAVAGWLVDYARDVATPLTRRTSHTLFATRGTTFTLRYRARDTIELVVLEGWTDIRHRAPAKLHQARIRQDTVARASSGSSLEVMRVSTFDLAGRVAWLDRKVVLTSGATVRDAAQELNRYNQVQLLTQGSTGDLQLRGRFDVLRPGDFAAAIRAMTGANVQFSGKVITIRNPDAQPLASR